MVWVSSKWRNTDVYIYPNNWRQSHLKLLLLYLSCLDEVSNKGWVQKEIIQLTCIFWPRILGFFQASHHFDQIMFTAFAAYTLSTLPGNLCIGRNDHLTPLPWSPYHVDIMWYNPAKSSSTGSIHSSFFLFTDRSVLWREIQYCCNSSLDSWSIIKQIDSGEDEGKNLLPDYEFVWLGVGRSASPQGQKP